MNHTLLNFLFNPSLFRPNTSAHPGTTRQRSPMTCTHGIVTQARTMRQISHLRDVIDNYDAVLLDQFGVIHDGRTPYPNALNAISKLHDFGVKIVVLSNSSRQAKDAAAKLEKMGVARNTIHGFVTSGQIALGRIRELMEQKPETRVLHITWTSTRGSVSIEDHNIRAFVATNKDLNGMRLPAPSDVDIILAHGTEGISSDIGNVESVPLGVLRELCREIGRERSDVPFYCANPDIVTVDGPVLRVMPGTLAKDFEDSGGRNVLRLGKPDAMAYQAAFELLGNADKKRVLAIGDSLGHDILGAANVGIDSLYIAGGINAEVFNINPEDGFKVAECAWQWDESAFDTLVLEEAADLGDRKPTYVSAFFRW